MLRVHFSPDDLARVRIAAHPDPLAETILSLPALQSAGGHGVALSGWRERTRAGWVPALRPLLELAPAGPGEYVPEVFAHATGVTLADGIDHTWSLPRRQWAADLRATDQLRPRAPRWIHALHHGDREWGGLVRGALSRYHAMAITPYWAQLTAAARSDRAGRAAALADSGVDGLLSGLHPDIRWASPVLHVPCESDGDLRLAGSGVLLVPTFFWPKPLALVDNADPGRPLVLRYPVVHELADHRAVWAPSALPGPDGGLAALLGTTRARVLRAVETAASTSELARRTGISDATASHHTGVLRAAGLVTTRRDGNRVRHALTPLGRALLGAGPP
ncbi:helix-turn-helix domain-containing protein [Streptomyces sp. NBC_01498]|uniref:ArsR/SmtB family transcription factor n=1 Tax=Streptomyces sp. NBC_01498 TaxID=2975870 RepID=UPI002E7B7AA0|nr:helix-turn-helix domain-containing protein [Streptomyces sp. NBC_01498]WTL24205.1 helix-turn-helix domain-containing protein [Streptomyces sp. NBC_01498]